MSAIASYKTINTRAINDQDRGLAISFTKQARALPVNLGADYRDAHRARSYMGSTPEARAIRAQRAEIALPHTIGFHSALPDGPDITGSAVSIKEPGSLVMGVPECFNFTLPIAQYAGADVLSLYGRERFENSKILLIVQRTDMDPGQAHRPLFADWHDHMSSPSGEIDLIYCFASDLPTEFSIGGKTVPAQKNALTRFGAEIRHRSPENPDSETLRRTWGACIVTDGRRTYTRADNNMPYNVANDESRLLEFRRAANHYLKQPLVTFVAAETLAPLGAVA